jgi:hypothetical protein
MNRVNPVLLLLPMLTPTSIVATLTQMQLCGTRCKQARALDFPLQGVGSAVLLMTS